jgi:hypothetical protein
MAKFLFMLLFFSVCSLKPSFSDERIALLIGNNSYAPHVGPLQNPHNDVELIGAALKRIGFKVFIVKDANYREMDVATRRYASHLRRAGKGAIGFFYYSGHGAANPETNTNYLIPVDVEDASDPNIWFYAFEQNTILERLRKRADNATHFVVFDACRNELKIAGAGLRSLGAQKGFVPIEDTSGLLIAYSTAPGMTASDIGENGGAYAKALALELLRPGVEAVTMFRAVQIRVRQQIQQNPWLSFPAFPEIYFAGRSTPDMQTVSPVKSEENPENSSAVLPDPPLSHEANAWAATKDTDSIAVLEAFTKEFPDSVYARMAKARIDELRAAAPVKEETSTGTEPADDGELATRQQRELQRVGCYASDVDGNWGPATRRAMAEYNAHAKTNFDSDTPSSEAIAALKKTYAQICPSRNQPAAQPRPTRKSVGGDGSSGNRDSSYRSSRLPGQKRCREGDISRCRVRCAEGSQKACQKLRELGG